jgi:hypothetical protein
MTVKFLSTENPNDLGCFTVYEDPGDGSTHARVVEPGHFEQNGALWVKTDLTKEGPEVEAVASAAWTDEVKAAWKALCQSQLPPPPSTHPADYTLSRRQIFRGLIVAGVTTDPDTFMRTILGAIADPTVRALALADWINEPAAGYHRTDPLFNEADLLAAAHMTAAQVDQLWLLSAQQGA